jgi:hypothetical protein
VKKLFAVAMLALAVPAFAAHSAGEAKAKEKSAKTPPPEKKADTADAGTAAPK